MNKDLFYKMIDRERNVYEIAELFEQKRNEVVSYLDLLQDPFSSKDLIISDDKIIGDSDYPIDNNIPNFTNQTPSSKEWGKLNKQFLNYHKSLSVYTIINSSPIINYLSISSGLGSKKNVKVLDVGGGTGHTLATFFEFPETIDYFLVDPNIRLIHDQFIRLYPKLSYLKMSHIQANAEFLPIKENSFDVVLNLSAIDHLDDYKKFISEAHRVLKPRGEFLIYSHLDIPPNEEEKTKLQSKLFSHSFFERLSRYRYFKKYAVGDDDHTLHLENEMPIEEALINQGFKIIKKEVFKRYFYFLTKK